MYHPGLFDATVCASMYLHAGVGACTAGGQWKVLPFPWKCSQAEMTMCCSNYPLSRNPGLSLNRLMVMMPLNCQVCYSVLDRRPGLLLPPVCERHGVQLLAYGTLAGGFLGDRFLGLPANK